MRKHPTLTCQNLYLFTTNLSYFYETHCLYARNHLSLLGWIDHLRDRIIPHYAETIEPVDCTHEALVNAAHKVKDYYESHVREIDLDGTSGQDRDSYSDDQDRDSYSTQED